MVSTELRRKNLAARIRLAREELSLSQDAFGRSLGYTGDQVHRWERQCTIDPIALQDVAQFTGRSLEWFYLPLYEDAPSNQ